MRRAGRPASRRLSSSIALQRREEVLTRLLEHRSRYVDIVVDGQRANHPRRRVRHRCDAMRQFGKRLGFDLLDQVADHVIEQRDMIVSKVIGAAEEKRGDSTQRFGAALGRAMLNDVFELRDQRLDGGNSHHKNTLPSVGRSAGTAKFARIYGQFLNERLALIRSGPALQIAGKSLYFRCLKTPS